jgi:hypothetical protein
MCRFCLEGALVRDLEELDDRQLLDAFGPPIEVLEEIDDLRLAVTNLDSGKHAIEVVMARVVEHYVLRGFDASIFEAVQQAYGHAAIAAFLDASRNAQPDLLGVALADITIYQQRKAWSRLIADRARLVSDAKDRLYDYLDSWCAVWLWPVVDDAAPTRPIVQQPARQSSGENAANLHARVIGDFAALAILCRYDPNAAVIRSIVAAQSMHQPGFSTVGLWLQRRALRHAVRHRGAPFLLQMLEFAKEAMALDLDDSVMRNELFHYGVANALLTRKEWQQLDAAHAEFIHTNGGLPINDVTAAATQMFIGNRLDASM